MRRQALWRVVLFVLGCYAWATGALAQAPQAPMVEAVEAVGMTVADVERSVGFYSNDLMHWQTTLVTRDITGVAHRLWAGKFAFVSPALVTLAEGQLGFTAGLLVRDPDGHAMQVIER
jgi:hypothetical protein